LHTCGPCIVVIVILTHTITRVLKTVEILGWKGGEFLNRRLFPQQDRGPYCGESWWPRTLGHGRRERPTRCLQL
jgi:hypothetical protein